MKNWKNLLALFLSVVSIFSVVGCKTNGETTDSPDEEVENPSDEVWEETGHYIVQNGTTEYQIVIADGASATIQLAASELQSFFAESTGITLPIATDENLTYSENTTYFSIGENAVFEDAGITLDKTALTNSGVRLITKGKTLFMCGGSDNGALYSVYTWLEEALNYEFYYDKIWEIDHGVTEIPLKNYDITDVPDFSIRDSQTSGVKTNNIFASRYRQRNSLYMEGTDLTIYYPEGGTSTQGTDGRICTVWIPRAKYAEEHPKWYAEGSRTQPCFLARGDSAEYDALLTKITEIIVNSFKNDPIGTRVVFGGEDDSSKCLCEACQEAEIKYGAASGAFLRFSNDIRVRVDEWMASTDGKPYAREWTLEPLFYLAYVHAPVKDVDGKKTATIRAGEGVIAYYAPISVKWSESIYHPDNSIWLQTTRDWALVADKISAWIYSTNFNQFLVALRTHDVISDILKELSANNCYFILIQGQSDQMGRCSGYNMLKDYVHSKLMWDTDADVNHLIDKWFSAVYGPAKEQMTEIYDEVMVNFIKSSEADFVNTGKKHDIYHNPFKKEFYSRNLLLRWLDMYDEALAIIDRTTQNETTQEMIYAERISALYLLVEIYGSEMTDAEKQGYVTQFFEQVSIANVQKYAHGYYIEALKSKYGYKG